MDHRRRELLASGAIVLIFLFIQLGALALVGPFEQEGLQEVENTSDPSLSIVYLAAILVATGLMLVALKYGGDEILRLIIIFAGAYIALFVFQALVPALVSVSIAGSSINVLAWAGALALGVALFVYPEWYVIDAAGVLMGIGASALFGINFGILPALVLLSVLAVYDAISVYGTEHMLTLASGVMDMRVPVLFVVPLSLSYSFLESDKPDTVPDEDPADEGEAVASDDSDEATPSDDYPNPDELADPDAKLDASTLNELGPDGVRNLDREWLEGIELDEDEVEELDDDVHETLQDIDGERDALYIGLGDAVIPTVLVTSAAFFVESGPTLSVLGVSATLPALTAMVGTMAGLVVLLWLVHQGRAHAGLPLLNGGTIAGYLIGALVSGLSLMEALGLSSFL
ncbi:presenilin family intramembrane aspartyl protease PSH [Halobacteriaceae archaeon SHR40]|uniref:presenilin family intramembrane aspartyl protease PSH n=1 Tax=Halovenus amylolytica TaxID=2500550 RepID=UPI000FE3F86B